MCVRGELNGIFPRIDRIFSTATLKRYFKEKGVGLGLKRFGLGFKVFGLGLGFRVNFVFRVKD